MGRKRNWKVRNNVTTIIDNSGLQQIELDDSLKALAENCDESNLLALPSQKRRTKVKDDRPKATKILSKKHRKRLEKIVEKKAKKEKRTSLLEALSKVQATPDELSSFTSISAIQTKGLRKFYFEEANPKKKIPKHDQLMLEGKVKINTIKGANKGKPKLPNSKIKVDDPNVVGFDSSSSSEDDSSGDSENEGESSPKKPRLDDNTICNVKEQEDAIEEKSKASDKCESDDVLIIKEPATVVEIKEEAIKQEEKLTVSDRKPAVYVDVIRSKEIQESRMKLPILAEEQQIMETINENPVVIIAGETGSGKTTQVPQFLYEAGYAVNKQIAITEPRRVAAIAMSKRVAEEMNLSSREVSYLIRFEANVTEDTKIKFMTDGVLLKELKSDFVLSKYSVIILDEAHERSVYTDVLIGLLSRVALLRKKRNDPLKLVIMSATLRLEDFINNKRLFKIPPPVLRVDARQFPVSIHFNKRTNEDYLKETFKKIAQINKKLPEGGILAFVTGQQEVNSLIRKLRKAFPLKYKHKAIRASEKNNKNDDNEDDGSDVEDYFQKSLKKAKKKTKKQTVIPAIDLDDYSIPGDNEDLLSGEESEISDDDDDVTVMSNCQPLWVLPLYSLLPSHKQANVFRPPPAGCRLCVISTNVAETSLTIPNIKYVVDTGKTKVKLYDKITGVSSYVVTWTSKASAEQRSGRAGRLGPGHCYRLYSSAVFNDSFKEFSVPEIQQKPVDDLYLQLKCLHIVKIVNFPFPTAPDLMQLKTAEHRLEVLGALKDGKVTPLGKEIAKYPILPRFGKMIALSHQHGLLPYTICLVAALSVQEVLLEVPISPASQDEAKKARQKWAAVRNQWASTGNSHLLGDNMVLLKAVGASEWANSQGKLEEFCNENGLRHKAVVEIRKLRIQLSNEIKMNCPDADIVVDPKLEPPTDLTAKHIRQVLLAGLGDQVAKRIDPDEIELKDGETRAKYMYAYKVVNMEEPVFMHSSSILRRSLPEYVVYNELYETNRIYMRGITAIEPEWLPTYVPSLCNLSEPLSDPEPTYNESNGKVYCTLTGTFGTQAWPLPNTQTVYPKMIDSYKWFARFLLEGKVFRKLEQYRESLLNQPSIMIKNWAKLQVRTVNILKALTAKDVCNKEALVNVWNENPEFLLKEYLMWLPESLHSTVSLIWPPLD